MKNKKQTYIAFIATAWGSRHGGINTFNADLCVALADYLSNTRKVICIVPDADETQIKEAKKKHVDLIKIDCKDEDIFIDQDKIETYAWTKLKSHIENKQIDWWVGHDIKTGFAANIFRIRYSEQINVISTSSAVICHMAYSSYGRLKGMNSEDLQEKTNFQSKVYSGAAKLFAVGPLLRDHASRLNRNKPAIQLVPGLNPEINRVSIKPKFTLISVGRLDRKNDPVKQARLGIAAFGEAIKQSNPKPNNDFKLKNDHRPEMYICGAEKSEENEIVRLAQEQAGEYVNVIPVPYTEDREKLFDILEKSSVALMLSWHEGFGLVGWEAIDREIPLIVSKSSGVYQLLYEEGNKGNALTGSVTAVSIQAQLNTDGMPYTDKTLSDVAHAIINCAENLDGKVSDAQQLKKILINDKGYTWGNTAKKFAQELGINIEQHSIPELTTEELSLSITKDAICFNQGEITQYIFIALNLHKQLKARFGGGSSKEDIVECKNALDDFLNRNLSRIVYRNFDVLSSYFEKRGAIQPRICIKHTQQIDSVEWILDLYRAEPVNYQSDFRLGVNTGFVHVRESGEYYFCNNIPNAVTEGSYINGRIDPQKAKAYVNNDHGNMVTSDERSIDLNWVRCWEGGNTAPNVQQARNFYKSTLIVPITLRNNNLDPLFSQLVTDKNDIRTTIFGFICFDHINRDFFNQADISMAYVIADLLSLFYITRSILTEFSTSYNECLTNTV